MIEVFKDICTVIGAMVILGLICGFAFVGLWVLYDHFKERMKIWSWIKQEYKKAQNQSKSESKPIEENCGKGAFHENQCR